MYLSKPTLLCGLTFNCVKSQMKYIPLSAHKEGDAGRTYFPLQSELRKTIVFITHDLNEALKLGDRIAIMRDGEIVQEGSPEEIVTLPTDQYVTEFVRDVSRAKVIQAKAIMREPDAVVYERQGPRAALHTMDSNHLDAVFLIARDFTLRGILTAEQVKAIAAQGRSTLQELPWKRCRSRRH